MGVMSHEVRRNWTQGLNPTGEGKISFSNKVRFLDFSCEWRYKRVYGTFSPIFQLPVVLLKIQLFVLFSVQDSLNFIQNSFDTDTNFRSIKICLKSRRIRF